MEKTNIDNLVIEITRKCNMTCDHCCRGDVQNMNIKSQYIDKLFKQVESINSLTITGGEPSLNPEAIQEIIELAKKNNVTIENFYLVTNAKQVSDQFMKAVLNMYLFCLDCRNGYDDEMSQYSLAISNDGHHSEVEKENINKLLAFRFAHKKQENDFELYDERSIIWEGKASLNYSCYRELEYSAFEIYDRQISEGEIYLNCKGNILPDCNMSYESQDLDGLIIGNVMDKDFNLLDAVIKWNGQIENMENRTAEAF